MEMIDTVAAKEDGLDPLSVKKSWQRRLCIVP